jgi:hypothetical protein
LRERAQKASLLAPIERFNPRILKKRGQRDYWKIGGEELLPGIELLIQWSEVQIPNEAIFT